MLAIKWASAIISLALLVATPSFAGRTSALQGMGGGPTEDHHALAMYYEEQAQLDKTNADVWDFMANYHTNFPEEFGALNVSEYISRCRTMAEDFRNLEKWHHKLALKHTSLMRKDVIP